MTEKIETNLKAPQFKVNNRVRNTKYENIFSKGYTEKESREIFIDDSVLKTFAWTYKIKNLKREEIIGNLLYIILLLFYLLYIILFIIICYK